MSESRKQFERWAKRSGYDLAITTAGDGKQAYYSVQTTLAWEGWRAAVRAMQRHAGRA